MTKEATSKSQTIYHSKLLKEFSCLGAECEDTCCKGWGMEVDIPHRNLYKAAAPELLDAISSGEADIIMKRDPETDYCVKFDNGLCGIHKEYGTNFLGDACYFYPRMTRKLGEETVMTAAFSCPEVTRLALFGDEPFALEETEVERLPVKLKDYLPTTLTAQQAIGCVEHFIRAAEDAEASPERILMRFITVSRSLESIPQPQWPEAIPFFLKMADGRLLPPEPHAADPYRILHALCGLIGASKPTKRPRLEAVIQTMEHALNAKMDWQKLEITNNAEDLSAYTNLKERWEKQAKTFFSPLLKRWIQGQVTLALFPFSGFGETLPERASIFAVRFATVRLALMSHVAEDGTPPSEETTVRVVQSLSRFLDHLMDPTLSLAIYRDAGWLREARMRGMLEE